MLTDVELSVAYYGSLAESLGRLGALRADFLKGRKRKNVIILIQNIFSVNILSLCK